jgi:hypothetical protein
MGLQRIAGRSSGNSDGRNGCLLGHRVMPEEFLPWIWGESSSGRGRKVQEKNQDNRRRSVGTEGGENRFLGGSDPTLSGLAAAQRLRRRGSLPPKLSSRVPRSVAGRAAGRKPNQFESLTAEEMKRWP